MRFLSYKVSEFTKMIPLFLKNYEVLNFLNAFGFD